VNSNTEKSILDIISKAGWGDKRNDEEAKDILIECLAKYQYLLQHSFMPKTPQHDILYLLELVLSWNNGFDFQDIPYEVLNNSDGYHAARLFNQTLKGVKLIKRLLNRGMLGKSCVIQLLEGVSYYDYATMGIVYSIAEDDIPILMRKAREVERTGNWFDIDYSIDGNLMLSDLINDGFNVSLKDGVRTPNNTTPINEQTINKKPVGDDVETSHWTSDHKSISDLLKDLDGDDDW